MLGGSAQEGASGVGRRRAPRTRRVDGHRDDHGPVIYGPRNMIAPPFQEPPFGAVRLWKIRIVMVFTVPVHMGHATGHAQIVGRVYVWLGWTQRHRVRGSPARSPGRIQPPRPVSGRGHGRDDLVGLRAARGVRRSAVDPAGQVIGLLRLRGDVERRRRYGHRQGDRRPAGVAARFAVEPLSRPGVRHPELLRRRHLHGGPGRCRHLREDRARPGRELRAHVPEDLRLHAQERRQVPRRQPGHRGRRPPLDRDGPGREGLAEYGKLLGRPRQGGQVR